MIVATDVTVHYGATVALDRVSCEATAGRLLAVTGASGAGKTSLLWSIAGLVPLRAGSVDVAEGASTHLVPQDNGLVSVLTARENVTIPLLAAGCGPKEAKRRAEESLIRLGVESQGEQLTEQLSGGQRQRVAVARAIAMRPSVLLADEVTSDLDGVNRDLVLTVLRDQAEQGAAVLVATHDIEVAEYCDDELHLVDGKAS